MSEVEMLLVKEFVRGGIFLFPEVYRLFATYSKSMGQYEHVKLLQLISFSSLNIQKTLEHVVFALRLNSNRDASGRAARDATPAAALDSRRVSPRLFGTALRCAKGCCHRGVNGALERWQY